MKQAVSRDVFDYWNRLRGARIAPRRDDIEPGAIRGRLADVFLLDADCEHAPSFRLAGSAVCGLFGKELKGRPFDALWSRSSRTRIGALLDHICEDHVGTVAHVIGNNDDNETLDLEMTLLPLLDADGRGAHMLGVLASVTAPYWLEQRPITSLDLDEIRFVGPAVDPIEPPRLRSGQDDPLGPRGFVLYRAHH